MHAGSLKTINSSIAKYIYIYIYNLVNLYGFRKHKLKTLRNYPALHSYLLVGLTVSELCGEGLCVIEMCVWFRMKAVVLGKMRLRIITHLSAPVKPWRYKCNHAGSKKIVEGNERDYSTMV